MLKSAHFHSYMEPMFHTSVHYMCVHVFLHLFTCVCAYVKGGMPVHRRREEDILAESVILGHHVGSGTESRSPGWIANSSIC